jgi:malate dehydrogenase (quinone)
MWSSNIIAAMKNIEVDVLLIGGGIMSATLGMLLHQLDSKLRIVMVEQLPEVALESSDALNNAGTGHAGYCELNYTPELDDRTINIKRALEINAGFETSLQFWSSLVELGVLPSPQHFINKTPHLSFVLGHENVEFLRQRFLQLKQHHLFKEMQFSADFEQLQEWMPLIMQDRDTKSPVAATYVKHGSDVDFGAITRYLVAYLKQSTNFTLLTETKVSQLSKLNQSSAEKSKDNHWLAKILNTSTKEKSSIKAKFVFLGAGGGTLPLLQKTGIDECQGYGGFPVSGQWLICNNPSIITQHYAKVYGKAAVGAPPMSVPHLDTRMINGKTALLFGPFAGFTTKFLKMGSILDLAKSIKKNNIRAMLGVSRHHTDLTKYLVKEATQTHEQRMASLRTFLPHAKSTDWQLSQAGQRVQIIKQCDKQWGKLEFGTEIVSTQDGTLAALLGASPGASVSAQAMIDVIERCFSQQLAQPEWQQKLKKLIPAYGESLIDNGALLKQVRQYTLTTLNLA